jgi:hypothetical protein
VGVRLADDLPEAGSKSGGWVLSELIRAPGFTTASQQIVGKPNSHALRAEATGRDPTSSRQDQRYVGIYGNTITPRTTRS